MFESDIKKVYLVDSDPVSFDWMIHREDIEHVCPEFVSDTTFVDIHIASVVLGIEIEQIEYLAARENPDRDSDFPLPEVRRGRQVRWRLKTLIDYIKKKVESEVEHRCDYRYRTVLEELRSLQRDSAGDM